MPTYELVLRGGRVIDPETGLDAVRDVAIDGGTDHRDRWITRRFQRRRRHRTRRRSGLHRPSQSRADAPRPTAASVRRRDDRPRSRRAVAASIDARLRAGGDTRLTDPLRVLRLVGRGADARDGRRPARRRHGGIDVAISATPRGRRRRPPNQVARILEPDRIRPRRRRDRHRHPRPATHPASTRTSTCSVARTRGDAGVPTFTHCRDLVEFTPDTLIDGAEEIVRAAGRDRRAHALLPRQQHVDASHRPRARARRALPRRRRHGHDRGVPVRFRRDGDRRCVPGARATRRTRSASVVADLPADR